MTYFLRSPDLHNPHILKDNINPSNAVFVGVVI